MTTQPLILRVLRVDTHSCIAHDCLWTCSCNNGIVASVGILMQNLALATCRYNRVCVGIGYIVAQVKQMTLLVTIDNLFGRKHSLSLRIPVYHTQTTVDESLLVQVDKYLEHALRTLFVHSKSCAIPVTTCAKST